MPFEDLPGPAQIEEALVATFERPPRPANRPQYGLTAKRKILLLKPMTKAEWDHFEFTKVTGIGWPAWFPVADSDRAAWATRRKGRKVVKPPKPEPLCDDYLRR